MWWESVGYLQFDLPYKLCKHTLSNCGSCGDMFDREHTISWAVCVCIIFIFKPNGKTCTIHDVFQQVTLVVQFRINWMYDLLNQCLLYFVGFGFGATNPTVTTGKTNAVPSHVSFKNKNHWSDLEYETLNMKLITSSVLGDTQ